jgi:hypothetical protein
MQHLQRRLTHRQGSERSRRTAQKETQRDQQRAGWQQQLKQQGHEQVAQSPPGAQRARRGLQTLMNAQERGHAPRRRELLSGPQPGQREQRRQKNRCGVSVQRHNDARAGSAGTHVPAQHRW